MAIKKTEQKTIVKPESVDQDMPATGPMGSEGVFATEVEARAFHEALRETSAQAATQGPERMAYQYSAVESLLRNIELSLTAYEQMILLDPADATFSFNADAIPPQAVLDVAKKLRAAINAARDEMAYESPVAQHSRVNPRDRYNSNIVR